MFRIKYVLFLLPSLLFSQSKKEPGDENLYRYEKTQPYEYGYLITRPKNYSNNLDSVPLFVFLHGRSLSGSNLNSIIDIYGVIYEKKRNVDSWNCSCTSK